MRLVSPSLVLTEGCIHRVVLLGKAGLTVAQCKTYCVCQYAACKKGLPVELTIGVRSEPGISSL